MTNALAAVGMRWQPSIAETAHAARCAAADNRAFGAAELAAAAASAQKWSAVKPQAHDAQLMAGIDVAVRLRGYSFAIRPRGTPPV